MSNQQIDVKDILDKAVAQVLDGLQQVYELPLMEEEIFRLHQQGKTEGEIVRAIAGFILQVAHGGVITFPSRRGAKVDDQPNRPD